MVIFEHDKQNLGLCQCQFTCTHNYFIHLIPTAELQSCVLVKIINLYDSTPTNSSRGPQPNNADLTCFSQNHQVGYPKIVWSMSSDRVTFKRWWPERWDWQTALLLTCQTTVSDLMRYSLSSQNVSMCIMCRVTPLHCTIHSVSEIVLKITQNLITTITMPRYQKYVRFIRGEIWQNSTAQKQARNFITHS